MVNPPKGRKHTFRWVHTTFNFLETDAVLFLKSNLNCESHITRVLNKICSSNLRQFYGDFYIVVMVFLFIFSAENMARLTEEVCGCKAELLSGGLSGNNAATIVTHLWERQPVLIPYPPHNQRKTSSGFYFIVKIFMTKHFLTICIDMMRTTTMSHAGAVATGHTGQSLQVILDKSLTEGLLREGGSAKVALM